ncbi:MAG: phytanoyl-CoA dioxygenase family protein [Bacteroidetes bacterium]|nr:phytanoyl-CoA dioxygenase family protein [Bacteroidota bacterium]
MQQVPALILKLMNESYPIDQNHIDFYRNNGFIKLKQVYSKEEIDYLNEVITTEVNTLNKQVLAMDQRDTYGKAFLQIMNIWKNSELVKEIVFGKKLAKIATELMEVTGVRLYHDQALYKEPNGGHTPWHADQYYWPLASDKTVTAWIPLQNTPLEWGPLEYSAGSDQLIDGRDKEISDESQQFLETALKNKGFVHVVEPFDIGEVSFHKGWLYHRAGPNQTNQMRKVMTVIYMDKDMKLKAPENKNQQNDWASWCPGAIIGETIDSPLNPIIYQH